MILFRKGLTAFLAICFTILGIRWIYIASPVFGYKASNNPVSTFFEYYAYSSIVIGLAAYWSARALTDVVFRLQERKKA